jgi:hypothetical protein
VFVINTIHVDVRDVHDASLLPAIRQSVTRTFRHLAGAWDVRLSASTEPGRWDLHVYGGFGHHISHILTSPDRLAEQLERRLRAFLSDVVPPLSAAPRRPVLVVRNRAQPPQRSYATRLQAIRKAS